MTFVYKLIHVVLRRRGCFKLNGKHDCKIIRHICFDYSTFKIIIKDGTGDNVNFDFFLLFSQSRTLILKSPERKSVLLTLIFPERIFLRKVSVTLTSPSGGLYTTLRTMFLE